MQPISTALIQTIPPSPAIRSTSSTNEVSTSVARVLTISTAEFKSPQVHVESKQPKKTDLGTVKAFYINALDVSSLDEKEVARIADEEGLERFVQSHALGGESALSALYNREPNKPSFSEFEARLKSENVQYLKSLADLKTHYLFLYLVKSITGHGARKYYISQPEQIGNELKVNFVKIPSSRGAADHSHHSKFLVWCMPKTVIPIESCTPTFTDHQIDETLLIKAYTKRNELYPKASKICDKLTFPSDYDKKGFLQRDNINLKPYPKQDWPTNFDNLSDEDKALLDSHANCICEIFLRERARTSTIQSLELPEIGSLRAGT